MASRKEHRFYLSRTAAQRNMDTLGDDFRGHAPSEREEDAASARERRRTGRRKSQREVEYQLGRISDLALKLNERDDVYNTRDNRSFKRVNKAFAIARRHASING